MNRFRMWTDSHRLDLLTLAALCAIVVLLWLPFGWNISGLTDEWVFFSQVQGGAPAVELNALRPFSLTGLSLAYELTPDSFVGLNILFAVLLVARGFAVYLLTRELIRDAPALASAAALLYVVYYGDTGWFWLTTFNIGWSALWTLLAIWLLLRQLRQPSRLVWLVMAVAQYLAMSYEGAFPLILAAPLLLPLVAGRFNRRVLVIAALWYIVPIILIVRYAVGTLAQDLAYQNAQLSIALGSESPLRDMANSVLRVYKRLLGGAFLERYTLWRETLPTLLYAATIASVSVGTVWLGLRWHRPVLRWRQVVTTGLAGLVLIGLGFASYLVSEFRDVDYRVYYFSSVGAALLFVAALFAVAYGGKWARRTVAVGALAAILIIAPRLGKLALAVGALLNLLLPARWLFLLGFAALIGIHSAFTLWQHRLYAEAPQGQHWILSGIIEQAPQPADGTLIVLLDDSPDRRAMWEFENRRDMLIGAVRYLFDNPTLDAAFCVPDAEVFGYFREACAFTEDGFYTRWTKFTLDERTVPYENVLVFSFDEERGVLLLEALSGEASGYDPSTIAGRGEPLPVRARSALEDFPTPRPERWINWSMLH